MTDKKLSGWSDEMEALAATCREHKCGVSVVDVERWAKHIRVGADDLERELAAAKEEQASWRRVVEVAGARVKDLEGLLSDADTYGRELLRRIKERDGKLTEAEATLARVRDAVNVLDADRASSEGKRPDSRFWDGYVRGLALAVGRLRALLAALTPPAQAEGAAEPLGTAWGDEQRRKAWPCVECGVVHGPGNTNSMCPRASNYHLGAEPPPEPAPKVPSADTVCRDGAVARVGQVANEMRQRLHCPGIAGDTDLERWLALLGPAPKAKACFRCAANGVRVYHGRGAVCPKTDPAGTVAGVLTELDRWIAERHGDRLAIELCELEEHRDRLRAAHGGVDGSRAPHST